MLPPGMELAGPKLVVFLETGGGDEGEMAPQDPVSLVLGGIFVASSASLLTFVTLWDGVTTTLTAESSAMMSLSRCWA